MHIYAQKDVPSESVYLHINVNAALFVSTIELASRLCLGSNTSQMLFFTTSLSHSMYLFPCEL